MSLLITPRADMACADLANLTACAYTPQFCCPVSTSCIDLTADHSSVICCPAGESCNYIEPISCDVVLQDASRYPYSSIHTSLLNQTLPSCGQQCCPLGYGCQLGVCTKNTSETLPIIPATISPAITPTRTSPASTYPARAILLGLFGGIVIGIALTLVAMLLLRKRQRKNGSMSQNHIQAFRSKTPRSVSRPVCTPQTTCSYRSDFLLQPDSHKTLLGSEGKLPYTPQSQMTPKRDSGLPPLFTSPLRFGLPVTPSLSPMKTRQVQHGHRQVDNGLYSAPKSCRNFDGTLTSPRRTQDKLYLPRQDQAKKYDADTNGSPRSHPSRQPSTETINVLMSPVLIVGNSKGGHRGASTHTTFQGMMENAGLKVGR